MHLNKKIVKEKAFALFKQYRVHMGIILFFIVWMLFFDEYNTIRVYKDKQRLKELKSDLEYFKEKTNHDRAKLKSLQTDPVELERFAREQYHLKKSNEEIFIIIEE